MTHSTYLLYSLHGMELQPLVPEALAAAHPLWQKDVQHWESGVDVDIGGAHAYCVPPKTTCGPVFVSGETTSSLDIAHALHSARLLPEWGSVLAVSQRSGRGQMRRCWVSPAGNIYAALRLPAKAPFSDSLYSLVCGYIFVRALESLGFYARIKWPNDILLEQGKVAGILLEDRAGALFAGIGINVAQAPADSMLRDQAATPACTLAQQGLDIGLFSLWQQLVDHAFFCYYDEVLRFNADGLISRLEGYLAWVGRVVTVRGSDFGGCPGRLVGLSHDGALRVLLSGREQVFQSCSLSLIP